MYFCIFNFIRYRYYGINNCSCSTNLLLDWVVIIKVVDYSFSLQFHGKILLRTTIAENAHGARSYLAATLEDSRTDIEPVRAKVVF